MIHCDDFPIISDHSVGCVQAYGGLAAELESSKAKLKRADTTVHDLRALLADRENDLTQSENDR